MKIQCPTCQAKFKAPDSYVDKKVKCLKCKNFFVIEPPKTDPTFPDLPKLANKLIPSVHPQNLFAKLWNGSPVYYKNSFLATLGVLSALAFAYYFMSIPKFLNKSTIMQEPKTDIISSSSDLNFAMCFVLQGYIYKLDTLCNVRANAARDFDLKNNAGLHSFLSVVQITKSQLEDLYLQAYKLNIPDNGNLQSCYQSLLNAINTESAFQKSITSYFQNPDSAEAKLKFEELSKKTFIDTTLAKTSILMLLMQTDANLYEKVSNVWSPNTK